MADDDDLLVLEIPTEVLRRHDARVLDPQTAARPAPKEPGRAAAAPGPTAYRSSSLLVRGLPGRGAAGTLQRLRSAAERAGYDVQLVVDEADLALEKRLGDAAEEIDGFYQTRVSIVGAGRPLDAWDLLVAARADGDLDADLEHLMLAAGYYATGGPGHWEGNGGPGHWEGNGGPGHWEGNGGGDVLARTSVSLGIASLTTADAPPERAPVVVIPDTGIGDHPWFRDGLCHVFTDLDGIPVGPAGGLDPDPEDRGVRNDLTGVLDRLSGHGTFIAGVVRQAAPDARLVGLPTVDSSGAAAEGDVHRTLVALYLMHARAQDAGRTEFDEADLSGGFAVDVLNLSIGFYHQDGTLSVDHPMQALLRAFGERGVLVVAAAGNDATRVPLYPAGWAAHASPPPADRSVVPLVGVGALNADGRTVAMFSNAGPWVTTHAPGANVVSTLPVSFQGSANPARSTPGDGALRSTGDSDDHSQGFAVWGGSSFAAPRVAGRVADHLAAVAREQGPSVDPTAMTTRAWSGLEQVVWT